MISFNVNGNDFSDLVSNLAVSVSHTYEGDIQRTLTGKVAQFPASFRTVGLNVQMIGKVSSLVNVLNIVQVNKVSLTFQEVVYNCTGGVFSCTEANLERLKDKGDKMGQLSLSFVSVGIPDLAVVDDAVVILAPDND